MLPYWNYCTYELLTPLTRMNLVSAIFHFAMTIKHSKMTLIIATCEVGP